MTESQLIEGDRVHHGGWAIDGTVIRVLDPDAGTGRIWCGRCEEPATITAGIIACTSPECGHAVPVEITYGVHFDGTTFTETECTRAELTRLPAPAGRS